MSEWQGQIHLEWPLMASQATASAFDQNEQPVPFPVLQHWTGSAEERQRLVHYLDYAVETVIITNAEAIIEYVNPAFEKTTGYSRDEVLGQNPRMLQSGRHDPGFYQDLWDELGRGNTWRGRLINKRKDGVFLFEDTVIVPLTSSAGAVTHYAAIKRDVTKKLFHEEQLLKVQQAEAMAALLDGFIHNFNNVMAAMNGYTDLLGMSLAKIAPDNTSYVEKIKKCEEQACILLQVLHALSTGPAAGKHLVRLGYFVNETAQMIQALFPSRIHLNVVVNDGPDTIVADACALRQLVIALFCHASDGIGEQGGTIDVVVQPIEIGGETNGPWPELAPGRYVRLRTADTGPGLVPAEHRQLFQPFFPVRSERDNAGLSLFAVDRVVRELGGAVAAFSGGDSGSVIDIALPGARPIEALPQDLAQLSRYQGTERILFAGQDDDLLGHFRKTLLMLGYHVTLQSDGAKALAVLQENPGCFDLVIANFVIPGGNALEWGKQAADRCPGLPMLLCATHKDNVSRGEARKCGFEQILRIPATMREAGLLIRRTLDMKT